VNIRGQVIGVNAAIASQTGYYAGYSFAIPMNLVRTVADQLIADGKVTRAALGIQVRDAGDEDAEYAGLDAVRGVLVVEFSGADSPARKAGIEREDIIVEVDGRRVDYVAQLQQIVGFKRPGEVVDVVVARRGGEQKTIQVRLTEANAEPQEVAAAEPSGPGEPTFQNKLGVAVEEMTAQMEAVDERLGAENNGLVVVAVDPNGPARGVLTAPDPQRRIIDVITHVDGERVTTLSGLRDLLSSVEVGDIVSLRVFTLQGQLAQTRVVRIRAGG
jgi:serine protease Do